MKTYVSSEHTKHTLSNLHQLTFEVTDACNLKCKYCGYGEFYEDYDVRENRNLPVEEAKLLIDYLANFWQSEYNVAANRHVYISFYGGEPLLNMSFIKEIIAYIEHLNIENRHFSFSMTTNAILLDKFMDFIVEKDFSLLISIDGNSKNNAYRVDKSGNAVFDKIVKNIDLLQNNYPEYFLRKVNFNSVLHNKNSVEEIYRFFKEKYDKIPSIGELNNMGIRKEKEKEFMQTYKNQMEDLYQSEHYNEIEKDMFIKSPSYQSVCTFLHQYSNFVYKDYNELLYGKSEANTWISGTCLPFGKKMFVTVNGKILPCERIGHQFALGQISENRIELDFDKIAEKYNQYFAKIEKQCENCCGKKSCIQCIFNLENLEEKPVCQGFMNKEDFDNYVSANMVFLSEHPEDYYRIMEEVIVE
ncbi:radical SAM peptide maturase [Bacteroidia bacterium]|nr:radical SAM peptide maturase [Bacteroidia bacterium]